MGSQEINWADKPIIGMVLINAERDSNGDAIMPYKFYEVGRHVSSGLIVLVPSKSDLRNEYFNEILKKSGKLN